MIFYEIELKSVPTIDIACSVEFKNYTNQFSCVPRILEIALCDEGRFQWDYADGRREIVYPKMVGAVTNLTDGKVQIYEKDKLQRHTTVGARADYEIKQCSTEEEYDVEGIKAKMKNNNIILLPNHTYLDEYYGPVLRELRKIISYHGGAGFNDRYKSISHWFLLVGLLTEFVLKKLEEKDNESTYIENIYAEKAIRYINSHYKENLTVDEIAQSLGISKGYLHRIFKKTQNTGVLEYINRHRISVIIELILNTNISLQEAAYNAGIEDPSYASRLFKKVTGTNYKDYIRLVKK